MRKNYLFLILLSLSNVASFLFAVVALILVVGYFYAQTLPNLSYWHLDETVDQYELRIDWHAVNSFEQYLAAEEALFGRLAQLTKDQQTTIAARWNRYDSGSSLNAARHPHNWNRSFVLRPSVSRGAVVLVHGLSDSPYSMRSLAETLVAKGLLVVGLRVPGHGTLAAALRDTHWQEYRRALLLAAQYASDQLTGEQPFLMVGYSNGAALITDYTLLALDDNSLRVPQRLVMLSPAMKVGTIAAFARAQRVLSDMPGFDKLAWLDVLPEYDPYKYNSFPVAAGEQIYALTSSLQKRLKVKKADNQLREFPEVLAFQSVVDATIPPDSIVTGLFDYLSNDNNQLVLFDVNSAAAVAPMLRTKHKSWVEALSSQAVLQYDLTLVKNSSPDSYNVTALSRARDQLNWVHDPLQLAWPESVYSLSHVALPFSDTDPWYGAGDNESQGDVLRLGAMEKRGERGVFGVSMDQLSRLRYNPFYDYMLQRTEQFIDRTPGE